MLCQKTCDVPFGITAIVSPDAPPAALPAGGLSAPHAAQLTMVAMNTNGTTYRVRLKPDATYEVMRSIFMDGGPGPSPQIDSIFLPLYRRVQRRVLDWSGPLETRRRRSWSARNQPP